ncbi:hypothetical protein L1987_53094 [Smallanthus sonchifolius]|uniref:Uncharacterized protein n=1 Tax=Smallanthus sonchifolius TaxID=185202 RepID=A0ACB9EUF0_9ASTR|nr:hypothetical protein L1987_53094 [Smallanthus sonchifolius]
MKIPRVSAEDIKIQKCLEVKDTEVNKELSLRKTYHRLELNAIVTKLKPFVPELITLPLSPESKKAPDLSRLSQPSPSLRSLFFNPSTPYDFIIAYWSGNRG